MNVFVVFQHVQCFMDLIIITARNEVVKVMFLQASVCPQRGVCLSAWWDTHTPEQTPPRADTPRSRHTPLEQTPHRSKHPPRSRHLPQSRHPSWEQTPPRADTPLGSRPPSPPRDGHCCGRYASYWKSFFF